MQPPQPLRAPRSLCVRNLIPRRHFNSAKLSSQSHYMARCVAYAARRSMSSMLRAGLIAFMRWLRLAATNHIHVISGNVLLNGANLQSP